MICVILHLYYTEMLPEFHSYLRNIGECDVYITISIEDDAVEAEIRKVLPNAHIKKVQNQGQDVGAFMSVIQDIDWSKYKYCIKLHTKKDGNWRNGLLSIIESTQKTSETINHLSTYKMVGSRKWRMTHIQGNELYYKHWCDRFGYAANPPIHYVAGTMFACTSDVVQEIAKHGISQDEFENGYRNDGRKEHAFERMFGKIVESVGGEILFT